MNNFWQIHNLSFLDVLTGMSNIAVTITLIVLVIDYLSRKKGLMSQQHSERLNRTYLYIRRIKEFEECFTSFVGYLQYKSGKKGLFVFSQNNSYSFDTDPVMACFVINKQINDFYQFLKELNDVLINNIKYELVYAEIITSSLRSRQIELDNFFDTADMIISERKLKRGESQKKGFGDFDKEELYKLKSDLKKYFDFIG